MSAKIRNGLGGNCQWLVSMFETSVIRSQRHTLQELSIGAIVRRRSLIGMCSFRLVNNRKGGEKVKSIGIDIGKRRCVVCVINQDGTILEEAGYDNTYGAARSFAKKAVAKYGKCQAVCESTTNLWLKTFEAFGDSSISIILANPMKTRAIAEASINADKADTKMLENLCLMQPNRENR